MILYMKKKKKKVVRGPAFGVALGIILGLFRSTNMLGPFFIILGHFFSGVCFWRVKGSSKGNLNLSRWSFRFDEITSFTFALGRQNDHFYGSILEVFWSPSPLLYSLWGAQRVSKKVFETKQIKKRYEQKNTTDATDASDASHGGGGP